MKKIIVNSAKDENGMFFNPSIKPADEKKKDPLLSDISLDDLLDKHLLILFRETRNLLEESAAGKLDKDSSQSMRDNLKLIMELKKKERELLENLSDDDLQKMTK